MHKLLVSAADVATHLNDPAWRVIDCRHDLVDTGYGEKAYAKGHIPGALFLHLDRDMAGVMTGKNGRHPLPEPGAFAARIAACGIGANTQVVAYDNEGSIFAAHFWWMLRWLGHENVAVLDGGLPSWRRAKLPLEIERPSVTPAEFPNRPGVVPATASSVLSALDDLRTLILDARSEERFSGAVEPLDPVAGHIPGSVNRFYFDNLDDAACFFKPADELHADYAAILGGRDAKAVIQMCGSGITACHNLLAMEIAGLPGSQLYAGSWSEWCADPARPTVTGA